MQRQRPHIQQAYSHAEQRPYTVYDFQGRAHLCAVVKLDEEAVFHSEHEGAGVHSSKCIIFRMLESVEDLSGHAQGSKSHLGAVVELDEQAAIHSEREGADLALQHASLAAHAGIQLQAEAPADRGHHAAHLCMHHERLQRISVDVCVSLCSNNSSRLSPAWMILKNAWYALTITD